MASLEDKILKDDRRENYVSDSDSGEEFQDAVSTTNPVLDGPQVRLFNITITHSVHLQRWSN